MGNCNCIGEFGSSDQSDRFGEYGQIAKNKIDKYEFNNMLEEMKNKVRERKFKSYYQASNLETDSDDDSDDDNSLSLVYSHIDTYRFLNYINRTDVQNQIFKHLNSLKGIYEIDYTVLHSLDVAYAIINVRAKNKLW